VVQDAIVGVIVVAALAWLVRSLVARARGGGCGCERAPTCPYAGGDGCAFGAPDRFRGDEGADVSDDVAGERP